MTIHFMSGQEKGARRAVPLQSANFSRDLRADGGGFFVEGLGERGGYVALFAGRRNQVDRAVTQGFEIFVPIGETRRHDDRNVASFCLDRREKIEVGAIGEMALTKNHANGLALQQSAAFAELRSLDGLQSLGLQNRTK